jgi:hypothetical protein
MSRKFRIKYQGLRFVRIADILASVPDLLDDVNALLFAKRKVTQGRTKGKSVQEV